LLSTIVDGGKVLGGTTSELKPVVAVTGCPRTRARVQSILEEACEVVEASSLPDDQIPNVRCLVTCRPPSDWNGSIGGEDCGPPVVVVRDRSEGDGILVAQHPRVVASIREPTLHDELLRIVLGTIVDEIVEDLRVRVMRAGASPRMRKALLRMLDWPIVDSVKRLAANLGCHPRTLRSEWTAFQPEGCEMGLKDILSMVLWLRILERRINGSGTRIEWTPWEEVAEDVFITPPRLRRITKAFAACRPSELTIGAIAAFLMSGAYQMARAIGQEGLAGD